MVAANINGGVPSAVIASNANGGANKEKDAVQVFYDFILILFIIVGDCNWWNGQTSGGGRRGPDGPRDGTAPTGCGQEAGAHALLCIVRTLSRIAKPVLQVNLI